MSERERYNSAKLAEQEGQEDLRILVEAYPGFIVTGGGTGANPVRGKFAAIRAVPEGRSAAEDLVREIENLTGRLAQEFPAQFTACRNTLAGDVAWALDDDDLRRAAEATGAIAGGAVRAAVGRED